LRYGDATDRAVLLQLAGEIEVGAVHLAPMLGRHRRERIVGHVHPDPDEDHRSVEQRDVLTVDLPNGVEQIKRCGDCSARRGKQRDHPIARAQPHLSCVRLGQLVHRLMVGAQRAVLFGRLGASLHRLLEQRRLVDVNVQDRRPRHPGLPSASPPLGCHRRVPDLPIVGA
jgi:hypothetical protein